MAGTEEEYLVVVVEFREGKYSREDYSRLCKQLVSLISQSNGLSPRELLVIAPKTIPKTTSGKISRARCREEYLHGQLHVLYKETPAETLQPLEIEKGGSVPAEPAGAAGTAGTAGESVSVGGEAMEEGVNLPSQLDKKDTVWVVGEIEGSARCTERSWRAACWRTSATSAGSCRTQWLYPWVGGWEA